MKKLFGAILAIVAITVVGVTQLNAQARDCDSNSVIYCGAYTKEEFTQKYNADAPGDLHAVYAHQGIDAANIANAKDGVAMKNGDVVVDGKVVATNAHSVGRTNRPGSTTFVAGGTTFYDRPNSLAFAADSIQAFVFFDANGQFTGAILKSCGNGLQATPVPIPPKPAAACVSLTSAPLERTRIRYTATATATNGAQITGYVFDFGDGQTVTNPGNVADHTYNQPGTYTTKVTVKTSIGDVTSPACSVSVTIAPAPAAECKSLVASVTNRTDYKLTATATVSGGATVKSYTFIIKDSSGNIVKSTTQISPELTGTLPDGTYNAQATINTSIGDRTSDACKASFTITPQPIAACQKLNVAISNRTHYTLTAIASVSGGATINGYTFVVKNSSGTVVSTVDSATPSVEGDLTTAGTYTAQVTAKTSLGDRTSEACTAVITIGVENCTVPGKENFPVNSPECVATPPELPKTGTTAGDGIIGLVGVSSIVASAGYYIASRRGLLAAMLGR